MSTTWKPSKPVTYDWPWLARELDSLKKGLEDAAPYLTLQFQTAEPARTFPGMIVLANATYWDPGNGSGLYRRNIDNTTWRKILDDNDIGTIATQNANNVSITGGSISGLSSLGVSGAIAGTGNIVTSGASALVGYTGGSGGTVTQTTDKSTAVTLDKPTGLITMNNAALAAGATVTFTLNSTAITNATNIGIVAYHDNATGWGNYRVEARATGAGTASIRVTNITGGSLSEAIAIRYWLTRVSTT